MDFFFLCKVSLSVWDDVNGMANGGGRWEVITLEWIELLVKALDTNWLKLLKETVKNGGCRTVVCWCWLCVTVRYESPRYARIYFLTWSHAFLPVLVFRVWWCSTKPREKGKMSSSKTCPSKYTFLMVASKKGRQKLYIKQNSRTRGGQEGEKERGMEDGLICQEKEWNRVRKKKTRKVHHVKWLAKWHWRTGFSSGAF